MSSPSDVLTSSPSSLEPPAPGVAARPKRSWSDYVAPVLGLAAFIGFWYFLHYWGLEHLWDKPRFLITAPHRVVDKSFLDSGNLADLLDALLYTTIVAMMGLAVAIVVGMSLAICMAQASWMERSIWPYLVAVQAIPILALVPIIGSIFGFGRGSRVFVCFLIAVFPIVSNTLFGLLSAERGQHDLFTLRGASRKTRLLKLQLPAALPAIFNGFRISAGLSVIGAVVGELFFKRGNKGIGILMDTYRSRNNYPLTYGALVLTALLGISVFVFFGWLSHLVIGRWHESTRTTA